MTPMKRICLEMLAGLFLTGIFISCGSQLEITPETVFWKDADREDIPEPENQAPEMVWLAIKRSFFDQAEQMADVDRNFRKLFGNPEQSYNINQFDEVPNSSWFTNRHGMNPLTSEELVNGRVVTPGPDTSGSWLVFRPKVGGVTPGFWIEDSRGDQYIIKFDPVGYPELSTGAGVVADRFFYACGYNVAQETIVYWHPSKLKIKQGATIRGSSGKKRSLTADDLQEILDGIQKEPDGSIRSLASLSLGNVKGPFSYNGRRSDDPNDWCSHENRRELRGLYVITSLVNHYDTKDYNTMDVYETENGKSFLNHYLLDFGSALGSDGNGLKAAHKGYANEIDLRDAGVSLLTLGIKTWAWEYAKPFKYKSVGYFESELFEANKFNSIVPLPAFENMTHRDAYWGAKIVMAFRDDDLRALVSAGQYTDPEAAEHLVQILSERRDKIGRHWFSKVNPLEYFETEITSGGLAIEFDDLSVKYGLEKQEAVYHYSIDYDGKTLIDDRETTASKIIIGPNEIKMLASGYTTNASPDTPEKHTFILDIKTSRSGGKLSKATRLSLWYHADREQLELIGIEHLD